jgi:hypothetical protein
MNFNLKIALYYIGIALLLVGLGWYLGLLTADHLYHH